MATETRSRNGCWTCKLRRKKCDERAPACLRCQSLNIPCHGFGERPEWMDGGARERAELSSIKLVVAQNSQHKRSSCSEEPSPSTAISRSRSASAAPHPAQKATHATTLDDHGGGNTDWSKRDVEHPVSKHALQPDGSQTDGPNHSTQWPAITLQDAVPLMRFFEDKPWGQSPFSCKRFCCYDRARYLWFVSKSPCLYLTTLALKAYHEHLSASNQPLHHGEEFIVRYGMAVAELQRSVQEIHQTVLGDEEVHGSCMLTCMLMLTEFNASRGNPEWRVHLQGASAMSYHCILGYDGRRARQTTPPGADLARPAPTLDLTNLFGWVLWYDILANISLGSRPGLWERYLTILDTETITGMNLEHITGCQSWLIVCVLKVYAFADWKKQLQATNHPNTWEFLGEAASIKEPLNAGITETFRTLVQQGVGQVPALGSFQWLESEVRLVTYIFACAAAILLEVVVSGANPALPPIQQYVARIVTILTALPNHDLLLALSWPLCISGCMAEPIHYCILTALLSPFESTNQGGLSHVLTVLRECWRLRNKSGNATYVGWEDAMTSLGIEILFV